MRNIYRIVIFLILMFFIYSSNFAQLKGLFIDVDENYLSNDSKELKKRMLNDSAYTDYKVIRLNTVISDEIIFVNLNESTFFTSTIIKKDNTVILTSDSDRINGKLFKYNDGYRGIININEDIFEIKPLDSLNHLLVKVDFSEDSKISCNTVDSMEKVDLTKSTIPQKLLSLTEECEIRVLVAYTSDAASYRGGIEQINNDIYYAEELTNDSYVNSNVNQRIKIVRTIETSYSESGVWDDDFNRLVQTTDGFMDELHTYRDIYSADVVVIIIKDATYDGQAGAIKAYPNSAFCAISTYGASLTSYYSFGHEIGHLSGCRHDTGSDGFTFPYANGHGFCYPPSSWRTIMSYNSGGCPTRLQYWSNPYIKYGGVNMGLTSTSDNTAVLNLRETALKEFKIVPNNYTIPDESVSAHNISDLIARSTLTSSQDFIADPDSKVTFKAGDEIVITDGFHAKRGSEFHAYIKASCVPLTKQANFKNDVKVETKLSISPNPVTSISDIMLTVGAADNVSLVLYDNLGNQRFTYLENISLKSGTYNYMLDGNELNSGMFVLLLKIDGKIITEKIINLK